MEISQFMTIVSILLAIGIIGLLFQKLLAVKAKHEGESYYFRNLQSYLPIFRKGLKIVYQNSWIFWLIFGIYLLNFAYNSSILFFIYKDQPLPSRGISSVQETTFVKIVCFVRAHGLSAFVRSLHNIGAFSNIFIGTPLILLAFLIIAWPLRKFLDRTSDSNFTASKSFLQKHFWPTVVVAASLLTLDTSVFIYGLRFAQQFQKFWDYPAILRLESIPHLYLSAVIISLIEGAILTVFREGRDKRKVPRAAVASGTVRHFKDLFFFNLLLFGIFNFLLLPTILAPQVYGRYYFYYRGLINFVFLLVIYLIAGRDYDFKSGLKENFLLWRRRFPEIIVFIFIGIGLLWIPHLLHFSRFPNPFWYIEAVAIGIRVFARLWIAATLMLFVLTITEREAETSDCQ